LKLMFGEMATETILSDLAVKPLRLREAGFTWRQETLEAALRHELIG
jgi:NAD dependent epimerase/dehydratase family enzyme